MGLFSFGGSKSKSSSNSNSNTFVDPRQQAYLDDIRSQAQRLNYQGGMPVEGVAGINSGLGNALGLANQAGQMQAGAGAGLMSNGANQMVGTGMALNYAGNAMNRGPNSGIGTAMRTGNRFANMAQGMNAAQGSGVNGQLANQMAGSAAQMNAASSNGLNFGLAQGIGGLAQGASAAGASGYDSTLASGAGGLASMAGVAQNSGFNQGNLSNYINNDVLSGQIDAANRDISRSLRENDLVNNASSAIGGGNLGSSRKQMLDFGSTERAKDRMADVSSGVRGAAYTKGMDIEASRASQNAQLAQGGNQFNAAAYNNMASQGLGIAGNQSSQNASMQQQTNLANQSAVNSMMGQGVGVAANQASQNAGFNQDANQYNTGAQNQLLNQGYQIGANQLESNLGRVQQANAANQNAYNSALNFGSSLGQNAFNTNLQNQQFGAGMAQQIGQAGVSNMATGQNMMNTGIASSQGAGQYMRDYEQQLLGNQYQQGMAPYNSLNFYNQIVGAPNNLSSANSSSTGKSSSFNMGFG